MSLSILCVTNGEPHAGQFLLRMSRLARLLDAEFVIGLDGPAKKAGFNMWCTRAIDLPDHDVPLQEMVSDIAVNACSGDFLLRLDDDEAVSPALQGWLAARGYESGQLFTFPRVYLYPDKKHYLTNDGMYPDLQTRLGKRPLMLGVNHIHAGNPNGAGQIMPFALEHHKLLVKSYEQRVTIGERYEAIRTGAGTRPEYARYNLPEMFYDRLEYKPYPDGDYSK